MREVSKIYLIFDGGRENANISKPFLPLSQLPNIGN